MGTNKEKAEELNIKKTVSLTKTPVADFLSKYYKENQDAIASMLGSFAVKVSIKEDEEVKD